MLPEEIGALTDLVEQLGWLHDRAQQRITDAWARRIRPGADGLWLLQPDWTRRVDRLVARHGFGSLARDILVAELGVLVGAVADAFGGADGGPENQRTAAGQDAVGVWRRGWSARAKRMVITETTRVISEQVVDAAAVRPGAFKRWRSRQDDRVRMSHRAADGQVVPVNQPFEVGDGWLMYPGDPTGQPEEVIGCRCRIEIVNSQGR